MKILITSDWNLGPVNGVVVSMKNLEAELKAMGHEVRYLTMSDSLKTEIDDRVYALGSISGNWVYPGVRIRVRSARKVYKMIEEWGPDVIHSQCEFVSFVMARALKKRLGVPLINTYHTVYEDYTHYFCPSKKLGKKLVAWFTRYISKKCDMLIAPTNKVARLLESYKVVCPVAVVPSGIDVDRYKNRLSEEECRNLKLKLNIPEGNRVAVFIGRMAKEKRLETLLDYWKKLNPENVTFLIVGGGPYEAVIKSYAEKLGITDSLCFAGMIDKSEVWKYYSVADFFMNASDSETQGLTYIEALASGLPVLAKKDECIEDVVIDGVNGRQFTDFETFKEGFAETSEKVASGEYHKEKISLTVERFSNRRFAESIFALYSIK